MHNTVQVNEDQPEVEARLIAATPEDLAIIAIKARWSTVDLIFTVDVWQTIVSRLITAGIVKENS